MAATAYGPPIKDKKKQIVPNKPSLICTVHSQPINWIEFELSPIEAGYECQGDGDDEEGCPNYVGSDAEWYSNKTGEKIDNRAWWRT